jgi:hypothetical protein
MLMVIKHWHAVFVTITIFFAGSIPAHAVDQVDFTGRYSEKASKAKDSVPTTLRVEQGKDFIEITRIEGDRTTVSRFPLDGSKGDYTSPGGVQGKGNVQFKGKNLLVESIVATRPDPNGPAMRVHMKERWELSSDGLMLTIRWGMDFPDTRAIIGGFTDQSGKDTYRRIDAK